MEEFDLQQKQFEWYFQWGKFQDNEMFLFKDWIYPNKLEDFKGKEVLEGGCGGGQHTSFVAPYVRSICAVDLNCTDLAIKRTQQFQNISFVEDDLAKMDLQRKFDIIFSIGVIHHTDDPDLTVRNLLRHLKSGGRFIFWVYSKEGNFWVENLVEPIRKILLKRLSREIVYKISLFVTALLYLPVYTIYLIPVFQFLPFFEYFKNFRKLSYIRNATNVFDKLNAPQVDFISYERARSWVSSSEYKDIHISPYMGVSWRISGTKK